MDNGKLVPDSLIIDILASVLDSKGKDINGVIFDGFPRTIAQAEALNSMLAERGTGVSAVIGLEVPDEELIKRIIARGKTSGRSDDNEETAKKRLDTYYSQTLPLKDFYINEGKYAKIEGVGSIETIFGDIKKAIEAVK
jgi:adenylate kinase